MPVNIRIIDRDPFTVDLIAEPPATADSEYLVKTIRLTFSSSTADLEPGNAIGIPQALLELDPAGSAQFKDWDTIVREATDDAAQHLVDSLRRRREVLCKSLAKLQLSIGAGATGPAFFGIRAIGTATISAEAEIELPALCDGCATPRLLVRATAAIGVSGLESSSNPPAAAVQSSFRILVFLSGPSPLAEIDLIGSALFDQLLHLPAIPLPTLSFADLNLSTIRIPRWIPSFPTSRLDFKWTHLVIHLTTDANGRLRIETPTRGVGTLTYAASQNVSSNLLTVSEFDLSLDGSAALSIAAIVAPGTNALGPVDLPSKEFAGVRIDPGKLHLTPTVNVRDNRPTSIGVNLLLPRFRLSSNRDGGTLIDLKIEAIANAAQGQRPSLKVTKVTLLDGSGISLSVGSIQAPDWSLPGAIGLQISIPPELTNLLRRLGDLLTEVLSALGKAANLLAGALIELLGKLYETLSAASTGIDVELWLSPEDYSPIQVAISNSKPAAKPFDFRSPSLDLSVGVHAKPALVLGRLLRPKTDTGDPSEFAAIVVTTSSPAVSSAAATPLMKLGTDLWLRNPKYDVTEAARDQDPSGNRSPTRLITLSAESATGQTLRIAVAVLRDGRAEFLRGMETAGSQTGQPIAVGGIAAFRALRLGLPLAENVDATVSIDFEKDRILPFFQRSQATTPVGSPSLAGRLSQYVKVIGTGKPRLDPGDGVIAVPLEVELKLGSGTAATQLATEMTLDLDLRRLTASLSARRIAIRGAPIDRSLFGLKFRVIARTGHADENNGSFTQFYLDFGDGDPRLTLARDSAVASLELAEVTRTGQGMVFDVDAFTLSRSGIDLSAGIRSTPVILAGVETAFRFTSGQLQIQNSEIIGATLVGAGQLPPALVGEATAEVAIRIGRDSRSNEIVLQAAQGSLKPAAPLVCEGTRFRFQIDELGFSFVRDNGYHFFFQLTGEARFRPGRAEFTSGLLKNLAKARIVLRRAPLAGDASVLARHIEFQVPIDPPASTTLFDLFRFELKGVGFHPASDQFEGNPAALSLSGQIAFTSGGDSPNARFDFHQLWIAPPKSGESLPRIRCDGLGVEVRTGLVGRISGVARAIDDTTALVSARSESVTALSAKGFQATMRLELSSWAPMTGSIGFVELQKRRADGSLTSPRHAFYAYGQGEQLAQPFSIFGYPAFQQEVGYGFGSGYTLAGIAEADRVATPQALVKVLDEVSRFQGSLNQFRSWQPDYDSNRMTLAMRSMFSMTTASQGGKWDEDAEKALAANPLLFDVVAALRSDLTLLMTGRLWLCTTYWDWKAAAMDAPWKSNPVLRGYLYLSVPRKMLLARAISDGTGHIGDKPMLPAPLRDALKNLRWSSTLYIAPGIFHAELGWPYELKYDLGNPKGHFFLALQGGLILRISEGATLYGSAFRARGFAQFGAKVGGRKFGAIAEARVDFALDGKLLAYVSTRRINDTFFYGAIQIDATISVRVRVWLEFKIFRKRIRFETGFSFRLALSVAVEIVVMADSPFLGAKARVSIGVRAFGRTLSLGLGVSFNNSALSLARSRVARYMDLGLGTAMPDPALSLDAVPSLPKPSPLPPPERANATLLDAGHPLDTADPEPDSDAEIADPDLPGDSDAPHCGREITETAYWAILVKIGDPRTSTKYLLQLIPRDHTGDTQTNPCSTFFGAPPRHDDAKGKPQPELAVHRLETSGGLSFDGLMSTVDLQGVRDMTGTVWDCPVNWDQLVLDDGATRLSLAGLLQEFFLAPPVDSTQAWGEPFPRPVARQPVPLGANPAEAQATLRAAADSRTRLTVEQRRECEIDERRSAFIAAIAEGALALAEQWDGKKETALPARLKDVDPRDLGLTFVLDETNLSKLFPTDGESANLRIRTRILHKDGAPPEWSAPAAVQLLNPPESFFELQQPRLADAQVTRHPQGLALDWDLEPPFGASTSIETDPEFQLRFYRIDRLIRDVGQDIAEARFTVKPAGPINHATSEGTARILRPAYQFIDDFADVEEPLRSILRGSPTDLRLSPRIIYSIVAEDLARTQADATVLEFPFTTQRPARAALSAAHLDIRYRVLPSPTRWNVPVALRLVLQDIDAELAQALRASRKRARATFGSPTFDESLLRYRIRVTRDTGRLQGMFGADPLRDDQRETPWSASVFAEYEVIVDAAARGADAVDLVFQLPGDARHSEEYPTRAYIRPITGQDNAPAPAFLQALGVHLRDAAHSPQPARALIAPAETRNRRSGPWRVLDLVLNIGKGADPVSVPVPRFEPPARIEFAALTADSLRTRSGRLDIVMPDPFGPNPVAYRDPQRRIAFGLGWHALGEDAEALRDDRQTHRVPGSLVGGYDLFTLAPDHLPPRRTTNGTTELDSDRAARFARFLGRVEVTPTTLYGLIPHETGPLTKVEAFYPSLSHRAAGAESAGRRGTIAWHSTAESFVEWPEPLQRKRLMLSIEESWVAALFQYGCPTATRAEVSWKDKAGNRHDDVFCPLLWPDSTNASATETVSKVRTWLRNLGMPAFDTATDTDLQCSLHCLVRGAGSTSSNFGWRSVVTISVMLGTDLHPMLDELLADLQYDGNQSRRYEVVREAVTRIATATLPEFLDSTTEGADPYGWGALRALGLAVGLRVYDTHSDRFLVGDELYDLVKQRLEIIQNDYADQTIGDLFIELMFPPDALLQVSGFDGGISNAPEERELLEKSLSFLQVSLRPRRVTSSGENLPPVFYCFVARAQASAVAQSVTGGKALPPAVGVSPLQYLDLLPFDVPRRQILGGSPTRLKSPTDTAVVPEDAWLARIVLREAVSRSDLPAHLNAWGLSPLPTDDLGELPSPFEQFPPLEPGALPSGPANPMARALASLRHWSRLPRPDDQQRAQAEDDAVLERLPAFGQRFLDHTAPELLMQNSANDNVVFSAWRRGSDVADLPRNEVHLAFCTVPQPDPWRPTIGNDGWIDILFLEKDRWGKTRHLAVRPVGRYDALVRAYDETPAGAGQDAPLPDARPSLVHALPHGNRHWRSVDVDRTEPVAPPVVLSAQRNDGSNGGPLRPGRDFHLVVARPQDEILSDANTGVARAVTSKGMGLTLWREYAAPRWASRAAAELGWTPLDLTPEISDRSGRVPAAPSEAADNVLDWADRHPDLWAGAQITTLHDLPYFYKVHALLYAAAGAVVSPVVRTTFPEGGYTLSWPEAAHWRVELIGGMRKLVVTWRAVRHVDCMTDEQRALWPAPHHPSVFDLPDPAVHYQLNRRLIDFEGAEIQVRPGATDLDTAEPLYRPETVGPRYGAANCHLHSNAGAPELTLQIDPATAQWSPVSGPLPPNRTLPPTLSPDVCSILWRRSFAVNGNPGQLEAGLKAAQPAAWHDSLARQFAALRASPAIPTVSLLIVASSKTDARALIAPPDEDPTPVELILFLPPTLEELVGILDQGLKNVVAALRRTLLFGSATAELRLRAMRGLAEPIDLPVSER